VTFGREAQEIGLVRKPRGWIQALAACQVSDKRQFESTEGLKPYDFRIQTLDNRSWLDVLIVDDWAIRTGGGRAHPESKLATRRRPRHPATFRSTRIRGLAHKSGIPGRGSSWHPKLPWSTVEWSAFQRVQRRPTEIVPPFPDRHPALRRIGPAAGDGTKQQHGTLSEGPAELRCQPAYAGRPWSDGG